MHEKLFGGLDPPRPAYWELTALSDPLAGTGKGKGWDLYGGDWRRSGNGERVRKKGTDS